jgi:hypothetical protein
VKSKVLGEDSFSHFKSKVHDPLDDLKDFKLKDFDLKNLRRSPKSNNYDDLDDNLNKKLDALDKESEGFYTSMVPKSKDSEDLDIDDDAPKKPLKAEDLLAAAESKIGASHKLDLDSKRRPKHRFSELDEELPKPKKFSDENLDDLPDEEDEKLKPKEEHHSQAYMKHLEQLKKQKNADAATPPSQKDPILGNFVKNLQTIASGENITLCTIL